MIANQLALLRRELWEHRSIYLTPASIALVLVMLTLAGLVFSTGFAKILDAAIVGASNVAGERELRIALTGFFVGESWLFLLGMFFLIVFYSLDSLYAERKDKSVLFWRSLPITDTETVLSKLITATVVIPLFTFVAIVATNLISLILASIFISMRGGDAGLLIWSAAPLFDNWAGALIIVLANGVWMAPWVGWTMLVSVYAKRSPFLLALLPIALIPLLEMIFNRSTYFVDAVVRPMPIFKNADFNLVINKDDFLASSELGSLLAILDIPKFFSSAAVWGGLFVGALLIAAAIYLRRFRADS